MNAYYAETASTVNSCPDCQPEQPKIPEVLDKANCCLYETLIVFQKIYTLMFGEEPKIADIPKAENLTQSAVFIADRADEVFRATKALAERLGA